MREVYVQVRCDTCLCDVNESEATNIQMTPDHPWSGDKHFEIDLCVTCLNKLLVSARPFKKDKPASSNKYICEVCGFEAKTPGGVKLHETRMHNQPKGTDHE